MRNSLPILALACAAALTLAAGVALFAFRRNVIEVIVLCALAGLLARVVPWG